MTAITRYPGAAWDTSLPLIPKSPPALGFALSHEFNASHIEAPAGSAVTVWRNERGSVNLTNAVGGVLREEGRSKYVEFSGVSGSLGATSEFAAGSLRTILVVARPNTGDIITGDGPVFSVNNDGMTQLDTDVAGLRTASTDTVRAVRDRWHVYGMTFPETGNGVFSVDGVTSEFAPYARNMTSLTLAIGGTSRRQLRVAHVLASPVAITPAQVADAYLTLKNHYSDLKFN